MNDYLIYLCLPPYLAQWYAHECNQVHNRDKATCPREIYRFPTPVVPVRGSQESVVDYSPLLYRLTSTPCERRLCRGSQVPHCCTIP